MYPNTFPQSSAGITACQFPFNPKVEKHPQNAPEINSNFLSLACITIIKEKKAVKK